MELPTFYVVATGQGVPEEGNPRRLIGSDHAVEMPQTAYYLRRVMSGELVEVAAPVHADVSADEARDHLFRRELDEQAQKALAKAHTTSKREE